MLDDLVEDSVRINSACLNKEYTAAAANQRSEVYRRCRSLIPFALQEKKNSQS